MTRLSILEYLVVLSLRLHESLTSMRSSLWSGFRKVSFRAAFSTFCCRKLTISQNDFPRFLEDLYTPVYVEESILDGGWTNKILVLSLSEFIHCLH